jgi:hypothetical protein
MLLVAAVPVAYLAGVTTDRLLACLGPDLLARCRRVLRFLLTACAVLVGGFAVRQWTSSDGAALAFHVYWVSLLVTVPAAFWILAPSRLPRWRWAWTGLLLVDLWALVWPLVQTRSQEEVYAPSPCVAWVAEKWGRFRVLDRDRADNRDGTPLGTGAPLAPIEEIEAVRGYSPLDVRRFKEYLQMVADRDAPLRPFDESGFTYPVIGNFPVHNRALLDLLGVRYIIQPSDWPLDQSSWRKVADDPLPHAYILDEGVTGLPPYTVYENPRALPRAFVVHAAAVLPDRPHVLQALKATSFQHMALLEAMGQEPPRFVSAQGDLPSRRVLVRSYRPNEIVIDVAAGRPGYLVLTDTWFPGWSCTVRGRERRAEPVYRADFLFRAVAVPGEACEVVFAFRPASLRLGTIISGAALALLASVLVGGGIRAGRLRRAAPGPRSTPGEASP